MGNIILSENNKSDFSSSGTLILSAPTNFEFRPGFGTTGATGGNVNITSTTVTTTQITIVYGVSGTNRFDVVTLSGLQIRAINIASTQNITRTAGTGTINGLTNGTTLTNTLNSSITSPPTVANAGSNQNLLMCVSSTTLSANTPTIGTGSWSIVSGGGTITNINSPTSTITSLPLGVTTTLRWTISNGSCTPSTSDMTITTVSDYSCLSYCTPTGNLDCATRGDYISNVTLNTLVNNSTCSAGGYIIYAPTGTQTTAVTKGNTYNLSIRTGPGNKKHGLGVWIDFNQNSSFADAGEYFSFGNNIIANSINTITITIPAGATIGTTRMRVRYGRQTNVSSTSSCSMNGTYGETEDYGITIINSIPCVSPTVKPTALILNANGTSITGSFTAPSPAPDNYLVV
ncbi:GEVED domain-containing protein, partial [Flavobacterium sp.]|uniref:GEVED domain-containing protein n=1 Tax=Flavobacterium sp. TaxID=239 RepID=UPI002C4CF9DE